MSKNNSRRNREVEPNERLIIHNLSFDTTEETLTQYFSQYGKVTEVDILRDEKSGRSRGFGFVSFETVEGATKANNEEAEREIDGRQVRTNFAKKRNRPSSRNQPGKKIYVGGLPWKLNEEELKSYFEKFGEVEDAFLSVVKYAPLIDGYPQHKGFGFVTYVNEEDANKTVAQKELSLKDCKLTLRKAKPQKGKGNKRRNRQRDEKKPRDDKKKPVVVKRKGGKKGPNKKPANKKPANKKVENKSEKNDSQPKQNNSQKKNSNKNKNPTNSSSNKGKGPRIVSSKKNPWKSVSQNDEPTAQEFPSLKKKNQDNKGKEEMN